MNDLIMGTKFEDTDLVYKVTHAEQQARKSLEKYFEEMLQNYNFVAGYLFSQADLNKLNIEQRPAFKYNLLLPIILQLAGNFVTNQSRVEARGRTPDDFKLAQICTDLMDYVHYTANDLNSVMATAFINAMIGRVGWISQDWTHNKDELGMLEIQSYNPFRIVWDTSGSKKDLSDCQFVMDSGWYTPEEIRNIYARDDDDLFDEITDKSKMLLGRDAQTGRLINMIERIWGAKVSYRGNEQGYDEASLLINNNLRLSGDYYDGDRALLNVIEYHERRYERSLNIYNPATDRLYDITKAVKASENCKEYDTHLMQAIKEQFTMYGIEPIVTSRSQMQMYKSTVLPAFNMKLTDDEPYAVQNGNFKFTPLYCFEIGSDMTQWKSYVDQMADPVRSFNLNENTMQTYAMKATHGETWVEEDALGEYEDDFTVNKIGAVKKVKKGALSQSKIFRPSISQLPNDLAQLNQEKKALVLEITGVRANAQGGSEGSGESGKLFQQRVMQSDIMQRFVQMNAITQLKVIGQNTLASLLNYLSAERVFFIAGDGADPFWLQLNGEIITQTFIDYNTKKFKVQATRGDIKTGKYDIVLNDAPVGEQAKQKEFQETMYLINIMKEINPQYIEPEILLKQSNIRDKEKWIAHIKAINQKTEDMASQNMVKEQELMNIQKQKEFNSLQKQELENQKLAMENKDKSNDLAVDDILANAVTDIVK